jgi:hypothetical protein
VRFNGEPANPEILGQQQARLLSIQPAWRPGLNGLLLEGKDPQGKAVRRPYGFVYSGDGSLNPGESAMLDYGSEGTKSGPFSTLMVQGDAVVLGKNRMVETYTIDPDGWIGRETRLVREVKAVKPGKAKILIFEKPHFLADEKLIREIAVTVNPVL